MLCNPLDDAYFDDRGHYIQNYIGSCSVDFSGGTTSELRHFLFNIEEYEARIRPFISVLVFHLHSSLLNITVRYRADDNWQKFSFHNRNLVFLNKCSEIIQRWRYFGEKYLFDVLDNPFIIWILLVAIMTSEVLMRCL